MSRSKKKPILKDRGLSTSEYWKPVRREWKQSLSKIPRNMELTCLFYYPEIKDFIESIEFRNPKAIRNDWDYCDWITDFEHDYYTNHWYSYQDLLNDRRLYSRK